MDATDNDELSRIEIDDDHPSAAPSRGMSDEELRGEWFFIEHGDVFVRLTAFEDDRARFVDQSDNEYVLPRAMVGGPVRLQVGTPEGETSLNE